MESWQNGRQELLEEVAKIYDIIGVNVQTELHREDTVLVPSDELRNLREQVARIDELQDELSSLKWKNLAKEAILNDERLAQERGVESEQLAKDNAHLTEELEKYKSALLQAQKLEGQSKPQTPILQPIQTASHRNSKPHDSKLTIISGNTPRSSSRSEVGDSKPITLDAYNSLASKYNLVFQNWTDIKATRVQLEKSLRGEREKIKQYKLFGDGLEKKIEKKRKKIRQLEEKVSSLEVEVQTLRQSSTLEVLEETRQRTAPTFLADTTRDYDPGVLSPSIYPSEGLALSDTREIIDPHVPNNIITDSQRAESSTSNLLQDPHSRTPYCSHSSSGLTGLENGPSRPGRPDEHSEAELKELPVPLSQEIIGGDAHVEDGGPTPLEPHHSSSTVDDLGSNCSNKAPGQEFAIKTESQVDVQSLDDTPAVILERAVKKRKGRSKPTGSKIKVEPISSSPIGLFAFSGLEPHESVDLDNIGDKQTTPRKNRLLMHERSKALPYESSSLQMKSNRIKNHNLSSSVSGPGHISPKTPVSRENYLGDSTPQRSSSVQQVLPRTSGHRAPKRRRVTSDIAVAELMEDGEIPQSVQRYPHSFGSDGRLVELLENPSTSNRVPIICLGDASNLTAVSNSRIPGRASEKNMPIDSAHSSQLRSRESSSCSQTSPEPALPENLPIASVELQNPARILSTSTATPLPSKATTIRTANPPLSSTTQKGKDQPREEIDPSRSDCPKNEPLRVRPLRRLGLNDFKINPDYNHGYNYAFADVVRNQASRRCLPGCRKLECCGATFRALAAAALDPYKLPTASQEEADTRLLKEFMGDNAYKIRNMTKAEKEELLLQAKTRELANKHGKHRQAYERRRSPPGFWRLEFPNTQEEREDRRKGEQLERDMVAQRYEEAMRSGGAYLFRDE